MKTIALTQGKVTCVDDDDYDSISKHRWRACKGNKTWYAKAYIKGSDGKTRDTPMHRFLLGVTKKQSIVDHIDTDGLNNTRINLRICTQSENLRNRGKQANNTSGYKGVSYDARDKVWLATIKLHGKQIRIGRFKYADLAYSAYRIMAHELHGEFARFE
jgi:hypothetical protein